MPEVKYIDIPDDKPEPTGVEQFFSGLSKSIKNRKDEHDLDTLISDYQQNREKKNAWEDLQLNLEKSTIAPTRRLQAQESLNATKKSLIEEEKALNAKYRARAFTPDERKKHIDNLVRTGMPIWEAEHYVDSPPGVQGRIEANHIEQVNRGFRKPIPTELSTIASQNPAQNAPGSNESTQGSPESSDIDIGKPEAPNEAKPVQPEAQVQKEIPKQPVKQEWPEIPPPAETTAAEREKGRAVNQKENSKVLQENKKKVTAIRDDQLLIKDMQRINDSKKLPTGPQKWISVDPEHGDIRVIAKLADNANAETQAYVKDINKFIKHAKDYFGARVTNFDLQAFMAQLPTLSNTEEGRRLILKQMEQESKLQSIYANKMDAAIKHYGRTANIIDISNVVDEQIRGEEEEQIRKMDLTIEASNFMTSMINNPEKFKGTTLYEKDGKFKAVPGGQVKIAEERGWKKF